MPEYDGVGNPAAGASSGLSPEALAAVSDGCSGGVTWFYRTWLGRDIGCRYCCDEHDVAYEEGGRREERREADRRFRECIRESGRPVRAVIFWCAVRLFGRRYWQHS